MSQEVFLTLYICVAHNSFLSFLWVIYIYNEVIEKTGVEVDTI